MGGTSLTYLLHIQTYRGSVCSGNVKNHILYKHDLIQCKYNIDAWRQKQILHIITQACPPSGHSFVFQLRQIVTTELPSEADQVQFRYHERLWDIQNNGVNILQWFCDIQNNGVNITEQFWDIQNNGVNIMEQFWNIQNNGVNIMERQ